MGSARAAAEKHVLKSRSRAPAHWTVPILQGNHGYFSHNGSATYAVDFDVPEGTQVVAARGGRVWAVRQDSNRGCATSSCAADGNYVIIDHGDGTFGKYWHLKLNGALVVPGARVCAGQPIALSGNTGWSTAPHLHLQVDDYYGQSLPLAFNEATESNGVPYAGARITSQNSPPASCTTAFSFSSCAPDTFAFMGVQLETAPPCSVAAPDQIFPLTGTVLGAGAKFLQVSTYHVDNSTWTSRCVPLTAGRFSTQLSWPAASYKGGTSYLMLAAAPTDCASFQGWDSSPKIQLFSAP